MKQPLFTGACTALVTPFLDGKVNYPMMEQLLKRQLDAGIRAVVVCGTTGEAPTLSDEEKLELFRRCKRYAGSNCIIIAGTGSNHTEYGKQLTKYASDAGAAACLIVTSYYNKATQNGLVKLFSEYASVSDVPIIAYNVPSRTGLNIEPSTYVKLAEIDGVAAIKEANGNISKIVDTFSLVGDKLDIYSGNDDQIVPFLSMGGKGVISVLSNVIPKETRELCTKFWEGDVAGSAALQCKYNELVKALFCEVNPIPVKEALAMMGWCDPILRSPLYRMEEQNLERLRKAMLDLGIIQ
jgi:4-hydroxy-tetrahydrodipicolinate synthase